MLNYIYSAIYIGYVFLLIGVVVRGQLPNISKLWQLLTTTFLSFIYIYVGLFQQLGLLFNCIFYEYIFLKWIVLPKEAAENIGKRNRLLLAVAFFQFIMVWFSVELGATLDYSYAVTHILGYYSFPAKILMILSYVMLDIVLYFIIKKMTEKSGKKIIILGGIFNPLCLFSLMLAPYYLPFDEKLLHKLIYG